MYCEIHNLDSSPNNLDNLRHLRPPSWPLVYRKASEAFQCGLRALEINTSSLTQPEPVTFAAPYIGNRATLVSIRAGQNQKSTDLELLVLF